MAGLHGFHGRPPSPAFIAGLHGLPWPAFMALAFMAFIVGLHGLSWPAFTAFADNVRVRGATRGLHGRLREARPRGPRELEDLEEHKGDGVNMTLSTAGARHWPLGVRPPPKEGDDVLETRFLEGYG